MKKLCLLLIASLSLVFLAGCAAEETAPLEETIPTEETEEHEIKETPEGVKYIVDPEEIVGGGPPKDGIPPLLITY